MAETLGEKLKRLAAEKKAAAAQAPEVKVTDTAPAVIADAQSVGEASGTNDIKRSDPINNLVATVDNKELQAQREAESIAVGVESSSNLTHPSLLDVDSNEEIKLTPTPSSHPLAMQFAEMESALLTADPTFKTILRDVHRHLGKDPDLVTLMTEAEVALVVKGLVVFANAEVVEPAKAKAVKAAAKTMKNISADDL